MAHPKSQDPSSLRKLKSPLNNVRKLGLARLKSKGTLVMLWITQGNVIDVRLNCVPWMTNTTPNRFDEQRFKKRLKGSMVFIHEVASQRLKIGNWSKQKTIPLNTSHPVLTKLSKLNHFEIKSHCMILLAFYIEV